MNTRMGEKVEGSPQIKKPSGYSQWVTEGSDADINDNGHEGAKLVPEGIGRTKSNSLGDNSGREGAMAVEHVVVTSGTMTSLTIVNNHTGDEINLMLRIGVDSPRNLEHLLRVIDVFTHNIRSILAYIPSRERRSKHYDIDDMVHKARSLITLRTKDAESQVSAGSSKYMLPSQHRDYLESWGSDLKRKYASVCEVWVGLRYPYDDPNEMEIILSLPDDDQKRDLQEHLRKSGEASQTQE